MRELFTVVVTVFLMTLVSFPFAEGHAADSDKNKEDDTSAEDTKEDADDYNDLGVKKGTKVYGEDISELSEDELQYVPKDWRDGKEKSEHPDKAEDDKKQARLQSNHPDVNDYIDSKNLPEANVTKDHKSVLPSFGYRNGKGKPEGVVAHETANDSSTINGEISYMVNNYNNAFVHAFVDDTNVKEIHSTDLAAWGAGRFANERFIHVELVRTNSFDEFARSVNNYANYIAELLEAYDLGVEEAKSNGTGTLWSHDKVSKYLGGTDHTDPVAYFAKWGYSWSDFVDLVEKKYNRGSVDYKATNNMGYIKSKKKKIHVNMTSSFDDTEKAGKKYTNEAFYVKQQAKKDGKTYYLISDIPSRKNGTIGWVEKKDIDLKKRKVLDTDDQTLAVSGSGAAYDKPQGKADNQVYNKLKSYKGQFFDVQGKEKIGKQTWYQGELDGKKVWIQDKHTDKNDIDTFTDVSPRSVHHQNIYELTNKGIIAGYPQDDDTFDFQPEDDILRSHTALIFTDALNLPAPDNEEAALQEFNDIDGSHTYAAEIAATHEANIFEGNDGKFMDNSLKREQMADVLVNAFDLEDTGDDPNIQLDNISPTHRDSVRILSQHGITDTKEDFRPNEKVKRGQFATFINRARKEK